MPVLQSREKVTRPPVAAPPKPQPGRRKSHKSWWAVGGLATSMLLAGGLFLVYRMTAERAVPAPSVPSLAVPPVPVSTSEQVTPPSGAPSQVVAAPVRPVPTKSPTVKPTAAPTATAKGNPSRANLALTGAVSASSIEGSPFPASKAVDGDPSTRWSSGFAEPQWLKVDLGERRQLTEVELVWEHAFATAYRVEVSLDGKAWRSIFSTSAGQGGTVTVDAKAAVARFVRMYGTKRSNQYGFSLFEFQVR